MSEQLTKIEQLAYETFPETELENFMKTNNYKNNKSLFWNLLMDTKGASEDFFSKHFQELSEVDLYSICIVMDLSDEFIKRHQTALKPFLRS